MSLLIGAALLASGAYGMGWFGTNVLFSEVSGIVLSNGNPVEGVKVTQTTLWSKEGTVPDNVTETDAAGRFSFPEISRPAGLSNLIPGEITIVQKISITAEGREYRGWLNTKTNYNREGERGRALRFTCDLDHKPDNSGDDFGVCRLVGS